MKYNLICLLCIIPRFIAKSSYAILTILLISVAHISHSEARNNHGVHGVGLYFITMTAIGSISLNDRNFPGMAWTAAMAGAHYHRRHIYRYGRNINRKFSSVASAAYCAGEAVCRAIGSLIYGSADSAGIESGFVEGGFVEDDFIEDSSHHVSNSKKLLDDFVRNKLLPLVLPEDGSVPSHSSMSAGMNLRTGEMAIGVSGTRVPISDDCGGGTWGCSEYSVWDKLGRPRFEDIIFSEAYSPKNAAKFVQKHGSYWMRQLRVIHGHREVMMPVCASCASRIPRAGFRFAHQNIRFGADMTYIILAKSGSVMPQKATFAHMINVVKENTLLGVIGVNAIVRQKLGLNQEILAGH
jgi:hypothetical protein